MLLADCIQHTDRRLALLLECLVRYQHAEVCAPIFNGIDAAVAAIDQVKGYLLRQFNLFVMALDAYIVLAAGVRCPGGRTVYGCLCQAAVAACGQNDKPGANAVGTVRLGHVVESRHLDYQPGSNSHCHAG